MFVQQPTLSSLIGAEIDAHLPEGFLRKNSLTTERATASVTSPSPGEVRAREIKEAISRHVPAPAIRDPPTAYGECRPVKKPRQRGKRTRPGDLVIWQKHTLTDRRALLCCVVEKKQPFGAQTTGADGSTVQIFPERKNEGFLHLKPLSEDRSCSLAELECVRHTDVVPLADGLTAVLTAVLAKNGDKLCRQLQLQLEAARDHLETRYPGESGNTPPQWLERVLATIREALAR